MKNKYGKSHKNSDVEHLRIFENKEFLYVELLIEEGD